MERGVLMTMETRARRRASSSRVFGREVAFSGDWTGLDGDGYVLDLPAPWGLWRWVVWALTGEVDFRCHACGELALVAPDPPDLPVCPTCCAEHDAERDGGVAEGWSCRYCGLPVERRW